MAKNLKNYVNFIILLLILFKLGINKNEIEIIINKTINDKIIYTGTINNIDSYYLNYISEIIVNGITTNISNYTNFLKTELNYITIKFKNHLTTCEKMFYNLVTFYLLIHQISSLKM